MTKSKPVYLDRNENHYGPAPACYEILRKVGTELLSDYPRDFQAGVYSQLTRRLGEMHGVDEKRIIIGYGCEDILKQTLQHFVQPGARVLLPTASWWYYRTLVGDIGGVIAEYPIVESEKTFRHDTPAILAARQTENLGLLLLASPNNPTGNILSRGDLLQILEAYRGIPVLLDQAYFGLVDNGPDDFAALTDQYPDLLVLRSFSKLHALAGVRVGYGIAGARMKALTTFCARSLGYNRISEALAMAALDDKAYYVEVREKMAADRELFYNRLRKFDGVRCYHSEANFVLASFPAAILQQLNDELKSQGFLVRLFKEPGLERTMRITLGTREENAAFLGAMAGILPGLLAQVA
jgi:histidinol-phosphate aminotransferase